MNMHYYHFVHQVQNLLFYSCKLCFGVLETPEGNYPALKMLNSQSPTLFVGPLVLSAWRRVGSLHCRLPWL